MSEMEPGRELDALVAEKVMGWLPWLELRGPEETRFVVWQKPGDREPSKKYRGLRPERFSRIASEDIDYHRMIVTYVGETWCPSTDISAAWQVVEKLAQDWQVGVEVGTSPEGARCLLAVGHRVAHSTRAETAPHAICLAALEAA